MNKPAVFVALGLITSTAAAQDWNLIRPSNTGIPGELVNFNKFGPDGRLWVSARWPFWQEGGIGIYDLATQVWETISNAKGKPELASPFINDIEFAAGGVTWIATDAGLVRWEGSTFKTFTTANAPLLHNVIRNISVAPNGHIWVNNTQVNFNNAAIFDFDGIATWKKFTVGVELPWDPPWKQLSSVHAAKDGRVWVANDVLNGVASYDGVSWTLHGADVDRFAGLTEDASGNMWMVAGVGGANAFYKFDGAVFTAYGSWNTPFFDTTITTVSPDPEGPVYAGNWVGQVIKTTDGGQNWGLFTVASAQVFSVAHDPASDDVWISTIGAVRHHDGAGTWLAGYNSYNTGIPDYFIDDIHLGAVSGLMWVASAEAGVSSFDGERWFNLGSHNPNNPWPPMADGAEGVFEDSQANVWIGTNGVGRWDGQTFTLWDWRNVPQFGVTSFKYFAEDKNGVIWAGTRYQELFRFQNGVWTKVPVVQQELHGMATDSAGNLWVTDWFALHRWDGATWTSWDGPPGKNFFDLGGTSALTVGPDGTVWIGTNDGLVRFDGADWKVYDQTNSPMPAKQVQGIDFRDDGLMAFSVHTFQSQTPFPNGVVVVNGDINSGENWTIYEYGTSPLPHYQLGDVAFDGQGDLWVSAYSGEAVAEILIGEAPCYPDCDGSGELDIDDFICFQTLFGLGDPGADCDQSGGLDIDDFICFQTAFGIGCP